MTKMKANEGQKLEYARLVARGMAKGEAYRKVFDASGKSDAAVRKAVSRLSRDVTVLGKVEELQREADSEAVLSVRARKEWLSRRVLEAAGGEPAEVANGIRAVQELNRVGGAYAAEKVEARVETCSFENILAIIEERKKNQRCDDNV